MHCFAHCVPFVRVAVKSSNEFCEQSTAIRVDSEKRLIPNNCNALEYNQLAQKKAASCQIISRAGCTTPEFRLVGEIISTILKILLFGASV